MTPDQEAARRAELIAQMDRADYPLANLGRFESRLLKPERNGPLSRLRIVLSLLFVLGFVVFVVFARGSA